MKVDMSPEAVTQRLRLMDDLWVLSVKLMNSRKVKIAVVEKKSTMLVGDCAENSDRLVHETFPKVK